MVNRKLRASAEETSGRQSTMLVVGIGAAAGGLPALRSFFNGVSDSTECAFVIVRSGTINESGIDVAAIRQMTARPVEEFDKKIKLTANTVYLTPPETGVAIEHNALRCEGDTQSQPLSIVDHFFSSLAEEYRSKAVGIILSGYGTDGTLGLKAIHDAGGLTLVQSESSAAVDASPRSASQWGMVDHVLAPEQMGREIINYARHVNDLDDDDVNRSVNHDVITAIPRIAAILEARTDHNFKHYKTTTLARRIKRRMLVVKANTVDEYLQRLQNDEEESHALFRDLLISVTAFFRDPEAFDSLSKKVIPKILQNAQHSDSLRVWVPACATGEEAYSLAILIHEELERSGLRVPIKIFATDLDDRALHHARRAVYPIGIQDDISEERLKKYFVKRANRYHVIKEIRESVVFSTHNVISDPPLTKLDLISCRNLLIYLGAHLQKKLIPLFHYALRPGGHLFLGPSENISDHKELFRVIDARYRISLRKSTQIEEVDETRLRATTANARISPTDGKQQVDLHQLGQRILLDEFSPQWAIVDEDARILALSADTSKYLQLAGGAFQNNVIKMARTGLRVGLRASLSDAMKSRRRVVHDRLTVRGPGGVQRVMLTVQPMPEVGEESGLFFLAFQDIGEPVPRVEFVADVERDASITIVEQLERELESTRNDLERTVQELETVNEDLKASNEELLSMNEELQSTNEELETSKEEVQTALTSLAHANNDLENLLRSTEIATLFLDGNLCVRGFTPAATAIYRLIQSDVGRPLIDLQPNAANMPPLPCPEMVHDDAAVVEDLVHTFDGRRFIRRVLPYRDTDGRPSGIVVTFSDVTNLQVTEERLNVALMGGNLAVFDIDTETGELWRSAYFDRIFGYEVPRESWTLAELAGHVAAEDRDRFKGSYDGLCQDPNSLWSLECRIVRGDNTVRWVAIHGRLSQHPGTITPYVSGTLLDITDRRSADALRQRLAAILDATPDLVGIAESDGRIGYLNPAGRALLEIPADENLDSMLIADLHPPDVVQKLAEEWLPIATANGIWEGETLVSTRSGKVIPLSQVIVCHKSDSGDVAAYSTIARDITERQRAELQVRESEMHLRRILDNLLAFVGVLDLDGTVLQANQTALVAGGLEPADVIGKKFWECSWWSHDPRVAHQLRAACERAARGEVVRYDAVVRMAGDELTMIDFMIGPAVDDQGRITHLIPSGIDIADRKRAEVALQESEAFVRSVLESSADCVKVLSLDGNLVSMNHPGQCAMEIDDFSTVCGVEWLQFWPEQSRPIVEQALQKARQGEVGRFQCACPTAKDTEKWWDVVVTPVAGPDGEPAQLCSISRDITEMMRADQALRESEERFRTMADNIAQFAWMADETGYIFWYNQRWFEFTGTNLEEMQGWGWQQVHHPEHIDRVVRKIKRCFATGEFWEDTFPLRSKDGSYRWFLSRAVPIRNDEGKVVRWFGTNTDVSEQRLADAQLREHALLLDLSHDAILVWKVDGGITYWNGGAAALYGYSPSEAIGRTSHDLLQSVHPEPFETIMTKILATGQWEGRIRHHTRDGRRVIVASRHQLVTRNDGYYVMEVNRDITEATHYEARLEEARQLAEAANQAKSEFLANMSHEIRTPMTAILGYADILSKHLSDPDNVQCVETIRRNGRFLLRILNDILDLSKIEANKLEIHRERVRPDSLVYDVRSLMEVPAGEKHLPLHVEFDGVIPESIDTDATRVRQILVNLIGNAIKFTETGSVRLIIRLLPEQELLEFSIIDTGVGMTPDQVSKLFRPFTQIDSSSTRHYGGTGLGLVISRRLSEMLGGNITVESRVDEGSRFIATISTGALDNIALVEPADDRCDNWHEAVETNGRLQGRILIVDDRREVRHLAQCFLEEAGAEVICATNGRHGCEELEKQRGIENIDAVVMDIQMPVMDGYEAAGHMRATGYVGPIIALTANAMKGDRERCLEAGFDDYTTKPLDALVLVQLLRRYLDMSHEELRSRRQ
ncbi:MAG: PAS domain S-box protein [Planctomycetales bacterium]|nr:PAS domain S-box protein [Planctomycetales bacterium]